MAARPLRWLYEELPRLVARGVLDPASAERIRQHYGPLPRPSASRRLLIVFGTLGALSMASGIVLLLAHNWEVLSRPARAAIALGLLLAGQALTAWTLWRRRESVAWSEGAAAFLVLVTGAALALISQTYQIGGDLEGLLFTVLWLVLPVVYLLRSRVAAGLAAVGITSWVHAGSWTGAFSWNRQLAGAALLAALAPFVARVLRRDSSANRTALLGWVVTVCLAVLLARLVNGVDELWIPAYSVLLGSIYVVGVQLQRRWSAGTSLWRQPLLVFGALGLAVMLLIGSFKAVWSETVPVVGQPERYGVLALLAMLALYALSGAATLGRRGQWPQAMLAASPLLLALVWALGSGGDAAWVGVALVNLWALAAGLSLGILALRHDRLGEANAGLLLFAGVLAMRFLDADWSFVARGTGFIVLGALFLAANVLMVRRRREVRS